MKLRKLELKDAPLMLEWMHDQSVVENLQANFAAKTLADCEAFIRGSECVTDNYHLAIADENDVYMGTVSLKNIRQGNRNGEFAITVRKCAMGTGLAASAMQEMIRIGLTELGLQKIYWCVSPKNQRAVRFYDKSGYARVSASSLRPVGYTLEQISCYYWYQVEKTLAILPK